MGLDHLAAALMLPAVAGLLWVKHAERTRLELAVKPLASGLFLVVGLVQVAVDPRYQAWILGGLCASLVGDALMVGKGRAWVGPGLVAFLAAHVCYLVAVVPLTDPATAAVCGAGLALAGGWALRGAWERLGRLRAAAILYLLVLASLTGAALGVWWAAPGARAGQLVGLGLLLFFVSDLAVLRYRFVEESFRTKLWGIPAYYAAQLLLAFSIGAPRAA